jgi:hypothetical protein
VLSHVLLAYIESILYVYPRIQLYYFLLVLLILYSLVINCFEAIDDGRYRTFTYISTNTGPTGPVSQHILRLSEFVLLQRKATNTASVHIHRVIQNT